MLPGKLFFHLADTWMRIFTMVLLMITIITSCSSPDFLPKDELQQYVRDTDNGLSKERKAGDLQMKVTYRPNDLLVWQEVEGERDTSKIQLAFDKYQNYCYFVLQLSAGERDALYGTARDQQEFSDRLQTLSFRMNQFINLTTEKDTIPVSDFYYSRTFGLSNTSDILLAFNNEKLKDADSFKFHVREFGFNTGRRFFTFQTKDILNSPRLKELQPYIITDRNM